MEKNEEVLRVEDVQNSENAVIIDVPDDVYVSSSGRYYYPEATAKASIKMPLEKAAENGYRPSKAYQKFIEKLCKEQQNKL